MFFLVDVVGKTLESLSEITFVLSWPTAIQIFSE